MQAPHEKTPFDTLRDAVPPKLRVAGPVAIGLILLSFHPNLTELVKLAGHVAWPLGLIAVMIVFRRQLMNGLDALATRIQDPNSQISIGKEGLEIKTKLEAAQAKIESLTYSQEQLRSLALETMEPPAKAKASGASKKAAAAAPKPSTVDPQLKSLADAYLKVREPDYVKRVRQKDELARKMANHVLRSPIRRSVLASQQNEGLILALAAAVHAFPRAGDLALLLKAAPRISRLHVRFWVLLAISRVFEEKLAGPEDTGAVRDILPHFADGADNSLARRIHQTEILLDELEGSAGGSG